MSAGSANTLRTLAFGELDSGQWGLVWKLGDADEVRIGTAADGAGLAVEPGHEWTIAHKADEDGDELPAPVTARICTVTVGAAEVQPARHLGIEVEQTVDGFGELDSLRQVLAWFAPDDALAVSAARPRKAGGHDRDHMIAAMFEPDGPLAIDEARLSTTYGAGGVATRMSLELWTTDEEHGYPRRAAGEANGPAIAAAAAEVRLEVHPMRCHRAGRDGLGLYVLARPLGAAR
jgi:hypothetical protein